MYKVLVNLYSWENPRLYSSGTEFSKGDRVVVKSEFGNDIGTIEDGNVNSREDPTQNIIRKATARDIDIFDKNENRQSEILKDCKNEAKRLGLAMKLNSAHVTLDGSNIIVIFTAEERIDFRELVKNLSKIMRRSVRMHQIGSRDEARKLGGCGICGRELCCMKFPGNLPGISIDMARIQKVSHRGSERVSGLCGRLMCCLSYESEQYKELLSGMPEVDSIVKTKEGRGKVIEINAIKQEIQVKLENNNIITIKKEDL